MKILLLVVVVLAAVPSSQAAQRREVRTRFAADGANLLSLASQLNLGLMNSFRPAESAKTAKGTQRQKLRQTYGGLDVVGAVADVELTRSGIMTGALSGTLAYSLEQDVPDSTACRRDTDDLLERGKRYLRDNHGANINDKTPVEQLQAVRKIQLDGKDGQARLVYQVQFYVDVDPTPSRPFFLMDACDPDLAVLVYFDKIHNMTLAMQKRIPPEEECDTTPRPATTVSPSPTGDCPDSQPAQGVGGNPKTEEITYGQERPFCLPSEVSDSQCTMISKYAKVIDLENTRSSSGRTPVEFECAEGYSDPVNGAFGVANDAFYYGHSTGQMYEEWYGFFALGYAPKLKVHYGDCYENAFWNGVDMTFGDGCSNLYPLVSQDVIAHELGHGITDRYSDLYYSGQSGGINEAFSDMSGEVAELFSRGSNDWEVGRELFKGNQALRYFKKPSKDGRSIDSANDYYDGIDVHYSSGVFNRAYWQLVNVQEVPLRRAYEIFLQANKVIWKETTDYEEGACGAMQAAYDLGYDVNKIKNAFSVVDIDLSSCDYSAFQETILDGETREDVVVSKLRNPVFTLKESEGTKVVIDSVTKNNEEVTVSVTSDAAGSQVISSGPTPFMFDMTSETKFFKVATTTDKDVIIDLSVATVS